MVGRQARAPRHTQPRNTSIRNLLLPLKLGAGSMALMLRLMGNMMMTPQYAADCNDCCVTNAAGQSTDHPDRRWT